MLKSSLDGNRLYKLHDKKDVYSSILKLPAQFETAWHDAHFLNLGIEPKKLKNVVFAGMGGSIMAGKIIHSLVPFMIDKPFEAVHNYRLPPYVGSKTLVFISSYSGNTQETLSCALDAKHRSAKVICLTSGGQLERMAQENHWPLVKFDTVNNPSKIPRLGLFQSLGASLSLTQRLSEKPSHIDPGRLTSLIGNTLDSVGRNTPLKNNPAKNLATKYQKQGLIIFGANHLWGVADNVKNFFNETAKTFAVSLSFPDLNHHFLDGLIYPERLRDNVAFLLINSHLYPSAIQKRVDLTKDILIKQKYRLSVIKPESASPFEQVIETLVFFTLFSYYLSIVNRVDPGNTPWVDYLKNHL